MRILIFSTTYFPLVGGAEVAMKEITDRIGDVQFDLICAKLRSDLPETEKIGNVTVHRVGFGSSWDKYLLPILGTWKACQLGTAQELPIAWALMASYGGFTALAYTWVRQQTKLLLTLQEGDPVEHYARRAGWLTFLHKEIFRRATVVHAISHFLANWAVSMGFKGKPEVVPNGVDLKRFQAQGTGPRAQYGLGQEDVVLVTASRLALKNGVDDLIRSLTKLPASTKLLIAGDGEDKDKLRVLTEQKGLNERVVFLGTVAHADLPDVLRAGDIFVRASLSEGLGNAFLEAMAVGLPIIGTPVGGIPDFLVDGETGVFCKPRDPDSIAAAVQRIQSEPGLRERLIRNGETLVREKYGWDGIAQRIRQTLLSLS